jgi:hypothetical protein
MAVPYFQIVYIVLCVAVLYLMINAVIQVLTGRCGSSHDALIVEKFANEEEMTQAYYNSLHSRAATIKKRIEAANLYAEGIRDTFNGLHGDICDVTKQIDDGIAQNYSSNVSEDEYSLPADLQKKRAEERRQKSLVYVKSLHTKYSEANDKTPLLECFEDGDGDTLRDKIIDEVNETEASLTEMEKNVGQLRNEISDKQIAIYYTTLGYNDKYLKEMVKQMKAVSEGFASGPDFQPLPPQPTLPNQEPGARLDRFLDRIVAAENTLGIMNGAVTKFKTGADLQKAQIKKTKAVSTKKY